MPSRGSGLEVAAARTTFSPKRTTAEPPACLASFPVSIESCFPPAISTETFVASGFIDHPFVMAEVRQKGMRQDTESVWTGVCQGPRLGTHFAEALLIWKLRSGAGPTRNRPRYYLRMPSLEMTVLYRSESYFFR